MSEATRLNSRGQMKPFLINDNTGIEHRCISFTDKDKGAQIHNSSGRGMLCWKKCGIYLIRDESFPDLIRDKKEEPKMREVVRRVLGDGNTIDDLDVGERHTFYRCKMLREGYSDRQIRQMENNFYEKHAWYLASLASQFNAPEEYLTEVKNG
jgi:hypothetical protein